MLCVGRLIVEASRFDAVRNTRPVGLLRKSDQPVAGVGTYTTHNQRTRRTSMPSALFEPAIPAIKQLQTYALDRTATEIGQKVIPFRKNKYLVSNIQRLNFRNY